MMKGKQFLVDAKRKRLDLHPDKAYEDFIIVEMSKRPIHRERIRRVSRSLFLWGQFRDLGI